MASINVHKDIGVPQDLLPADSISAIAFCPVQHSPNLDFLAVASWDTSVRIYMINTQPPAIPNPSAPQVTVTNITAYHMYNHTGPVLCMLR